MTPTTCQARGWHAWCPCQDADERGTFEVSVCGDCGLELADPDEIEAEDAAIATED